MAIQQTTPDQYTAGRSSGRSQVIDRILEIAGEEAARVGPERIRMGEIAQRADVSRASLYRYFASKDELIRAWTTRELDTIFRRIDRATAEYENFDDRLAEAFAVALTELREHPVFSSIFAINDTQIMRSTLQSNDAIGHARDQALERFNNAVHERRLRIDQYDASVAGELLTRITISLAESPESVGRLDTTEDAREFGRSYLAPLVRALSNEY
jgi:AcrR family transcriptional regulator